MKNINKYLLFIIMLCALPFISCGHDSGGVPAEKKIKVVTTLFPLYDYARNIGQDKAEVIILVPPGLEAHSFEPRASDMRRIQEADLFIYTGKFMEPWVEDLIRGIDRSRVTVIDSSAGVELLVHGPAKKSDDRRHGHVDPHIWLDFGNAQTMAENIAAGFIARDPQNQEFYRKNADDYKTGLRRLDKKYLQTLARCPQNTIYHAGHFAFGYLAKRYGINYVSAYQGVNAEAEPTPRRVAELTKTLQDRKVRHIFYEELAEPRLATALSAETGAKLLILHGAHNVSRKEMEGNVSFIGLMEQNLENLKAGLSCP